MCAVNLSQMLWIRIRVAIWKKNHFLSRKFSNASLESPDDVNTGVCVNEVRHLADPDGEGGLFERSLHLPTAEHTKVASLLSWATLTVFTGDPREIFLGLDLRPELLNVGNSFFLGSSDLSVPEAVDGVSWASMLLEDVEYLNLICHLFSKGINAIICL